MYRVVFTDQAFQSLKKFDKNVSRMILAWIRKNLEGCDDPRRLGKALIGNYAGRWRYEAGDYRIMAEISDERLRYMLLI